MNRIEEQAAEFRIPGLLVTGAGAASRIPDVVARLRVDGVVVVTDRNLGPVVQPVIDHIDSAGQLCSVFDGVTTEPTTDHVEAVVDEMARTGAGGIVAIGGGSAIDTGKGAAAIIENQGSLRDYQGYDLFQEPPRPLVAVPTTGGTGSEATRVIVITDSRSRVKMLFVADQLIAAAAVVDPLLTVTCPPPVTASAGVDALSHAIEAYVSRRAQPLTDLLALSACAALSSSLRTAYRDGNNIPARTRILHGALEAGMAFSNSSVALVHGMSRPLGAVFGIPHGIANAMLLPAVMQFGLEEAMERYGDIGEAMGVAEPNASHEARAAAAVAEVDSLVADLGIPTLGGFGLDEQRFEQELEKMAEDAIASGSPANNPRIPTRGEIIDLYRQCF